MQRADFAVVSRGVPVACACYCSCLADYETGISTQHPPWVLTCVENVLIGTHKELLGVQVDFMAGWW
jgi:hypothetical protein